MKLLLTISLLFSIAQAQSIDTVQRVFEVEDRNKNYKLLKRYTIKGYVIRDNMADGWYRPIKYLDNNRNELSQLWVLIRDENAPYRVFKFVKFKL